METVFLCATGSVIGALVGILVKKLAPETGTALSVFVSASVMVCAIGCYGTVLNVAEELLSQTALPLECGEILVRICGVSIVSKLSSGLARMAGDEGIADAMDMLGAGSSVLCSLPLWQSLAEILFSFTR